MPTTQSQKVVKAANFDDETRRFHDKQKNMLKAIKIRQVEARSRISRDRTNRKEDLQARIDSLKRSSSVKQPGTNASFDHTAFEALRDLLANKADIERRIAQSIDSLEKAMNAASREFQAVLISQAEAFKITRMPASTTAAAASSKALVVKQ